MAENEDVGIKGTINGVITNHDGTHVVEGNAEFEEYLNAVKTALDEVENNDEIKKDRS